MGARTLLWLRTTALKWLGWWALAFLLNVLVALPFLLSKASGNNAAWTSFPLDDSWIHLVYVRSLVTQGGLYYNPGIWEAGATSWGWLFFLAPFYTVGTLWLHIDVVIVVKFVGLALGGLCTLFAYRLFFRITKGKIVSLLGAALITLEPTFAFHRISGMEGTLLVATVLGATLALLNRRWLWAGLLIAFSFWTRPDASFYVAAALAIGGILWVIRHRREILATLNLIWIHPTPEGAEAQPNGPPPEVPVWPPLRNELLPLALPSLLALGSWLGYNKLINGTWFPNTYLIKHDFGLPMLPLRNIYYAFQGGMASFQPWLDGWLLMPILVLCLGGIWYATRREKFPLWTLALFPFLLLIGVGKGAGYVDGGAFSFWTRRYLDPATPIVLFFIILGASVCLAWLRSILMKQVKSPAAQLLLFIPGFLVVANILAVSMIQDIKVWKTMVADFSWNSRNIEDEDVLAGKWVKENTPEDATVLVFDAGAICYYGERFTYDVVGLNYHDIIGKKVEIDVMLDDKPDYLVVWDVPRYAQFPNAERVAQFTTPRNTILNGAVVGVFQMSWPEGLFQDPTALYAVSYSGSIVDQLHITEKPSEASHNHFISFAGYAPRGIGRIGQAPLIDVGISHGKDVTERFTMVAIPEKPLTLALRFQTTYDGSGELFIDGVSAGRLTIKGSDAAFQEQAVTIPANLVKSDHPTIEVHWDTTYMIEFRWWAIAGEII